MWTPRRSHDQPEKNPSATDGHATNSTSRKHIGTKSSDSRPSIDSPRRRSSSDSATPRQTPVSNTRFLSSTAAAAQDPNRNVLSPSSATDAFSSSKRLGFFAEKLSGHSPVHSVDQKSLLQPFHPRADSALAQNTLTPNMASSSTMTGSKTHTSPSKASYGRTYDSKLVSREMQRLGNLAHIPSGLAPAMSQAPSVASLSHPAAGSMSQVSLASTSSNDPWGALHVHVLPLFNGEPLRIPIEDLNVLVKRHIHTVITASLPKSIPKALATLEHDASELIAAGMVTLNAKLIGIEDDKLVGRVVEIWGFFWDQVLTYIEGVLLPLQTDPFILDFQRPSKRPSSPSRQNIKGSISTTLTGTLHPSGPCIDVRTVALRSFRDKVIFPLSPRLYARLSMSNRQDSFQETAAYQQPRLQQMLLVLTSQSRQRPPMVSLTASPPQSPPSEAAIVDLLRLVRSPRPQFDRRIPKSPVGHNRAPSFLSGGVPRDRRGRVAHKQMTAFSGDGDEDGIFGDETPRNGAGLVVDVDREREREFLEALRSPDPENNTRASVGGWGLGGGNVDNSKAADEEEEDEPLDWDQAQAVVERMVGMNSQTDTSSRRRMT